MKQLLVLSVFLTLFFSCKKAKVSEPALPQVYVPTPRVPTQTGENVLSFKIDGVTHIYSGTPSYFNVNGINGFIMQYPDETKGIEIYATSTAYNDRLSLIVNVLSETNQNSIPTIGVKYFLTRNHYSYSYYMPSYGGNESEYMPIDSLSSITFARFDDKVIAGTFEFHSYGNKGKTVDLTEGYFDIPR